MLPFLGHPVCDYNYTLCSAGHKSHIQQLMDKENKFSLLWQFQCFLNSYILQGFVLVLGREIWKANRVENRGSISQFLTPVKFRGGMRKISEWIFQVQLRTDPLILLPGRRCTCWATVVLLSRCDLDLWPVDLERLWYIKRHVIKVCTKFERNRAIRGWIIDNFAKFARIMSHCDLNLWPLDLELLKRVACHAFKLHTQFVENRVIHGWVVDDWARFCRAILGGVALLLSRSQDA